MGYDKLYNKAKLRARSEEALMRSGAKKSRPGVLLVGEGSTEYNYCNELKRSYRNSDVNIIIKKPPGSAPISIVNFAIDFANKNEDIDYVFCIFDRDEHSSYKEAIDKIRHYKPSKSAKSKPLFKEITFVPCFEIWSLLHFEFTTKSYTKSGNKTACDMVIVDLQKHLPDYIKGMVNLFHALQPKLNVAVINATKLLEHNKKTDTVNPSTNMHELIESIKTMAKAP